MKNLTLARTRTQVPLFSSADALTTELRVPVAETEFFILMSFQILNFDKGWHNLTALIQKKEKYIK